MRWPWSPRPIADPDVQKPVRIEVPTGPVAPRLTRLYIGLVDHGARLVIQMENTTGTHVAAAFDGLEVDELIDALTEHRRLMTAVATREGG